MELSLNIDWGVQESDPMVNALVERILAEETRGFAEAVRQRLAAEGITDITMKYSETTT